MRMARLVPLRQTLGGVLSIKCVHRDFDCFLSRINEPSSERFAINFILNIEPARRVYAAWGEWPFYLPLPVVTVKPPSFFCAGLLFLLFSFAISVGDFDTLYEALPSAPN